MSDLSPAGCGRVPRNFIVLRYPSRQKCFLSFFSSACVVTLFNSMSQVVSGARSDRSNGLPGALPESVQSVWVSTTDQLPGVLGIISWSETVQTGLAHERTFLPKQENIGTAVHRSTLTDEIDSRCVSRSPRKLRKLSVVTSRCRPPACQFFVLRPGYGQPDNQDPYVLSVGACLLTSRPTWLRGYPVQQ